MGLNVQVINKAENRTLLSQHITDCKKIKQVYPVN